MDILYTLIPLSVVLIFAVLVVLGWAVHAGQLEDLDIEAARILDEPSPDRDDPAALPARRAPAGGSLDLTQAPAGRPPSAS